MLWPFRQAWVTSDNATTNDRAMRILQQTLNNTVKGRSWLAQEHCVRYVCVCIFL